MILLKALLFAAFLLPNTIASTANIPNVATTETITTNQVKYIVNNSGSSAVTFSFIIIQDDVLTLTTGGQTVPPGGQVTILVNVSTNGHSYALELTEGPPSS